tara:strand:+ start:263 stop:400 length:138 start_codon:yes stop_codon:yes gene_type:complete
MARNSATDLEDWMIEKPAGFGYLPDLQADALKFAIKQAEPMARNL